MLPKIKAEIINNATLEDVCSFVSKSETKLQNQVYRRCHVPILAQKESQLDFKASYTSELCVEACTVRVYQATHPPEERRVREGLAR